MDTKNKIKIEEEKKILDELRTKLYSIDEKTATVEEVKKIVRHVDYRIIKIRSLDNEDEILRR